MPADPPAPDLRPRALRPRSLPGVPWSALAVAAGTGQEPGVSVAGTVEHRTVTGVTLDSRLVEPGDLYVALPGRHHHGARFAPGAAAAGAVGVLTDAAGRQLLGDLGLPVLVVPDPRRTMAVVAAQVYGEPAGRMTMLGLTGTNGKTTTSYLLEAGLRAAGRHTGLVGTIGFLLDGTPLAAERTTVTTPESPELQGLLAVLAESGADACVMEVSSHALALDRVSAITFDVAGFTNLGQDHLDFHGDQESYFEAKALLFAPDRARHAVVNVDDPRGRQLVDRIRTAGAPRLSTVALDAADADYRAVDVRPEPGGRTRLTVRTPLTEVPVTLGLPGVFNVRNALTALAMLDALGVDLLRAAGGLATATVPGRMERVELGDGAPTVFVDFAHTPQAVTAALRAVPGPRRLTVLGCGGDRDPAKRSPIGAAAVQDADVVVVTDDNPRTEDPAAIRAQLLAGARDAVRSTGRATQVLEQGDRRAAIHRALQLARAGDVLLVLGKGHETGQQVGAEVLPFSDVAVVREEWARLVEPQNAS